MSGTKEVLPDINLLEVVTIISLIHPSEKSGAEPGKRDYSSKAKKTLVGDLAQGKRLGALYQSCQMEFLRGRMV